jgi:hypothetical protein
LDFGNFDGVDSNGVTSPFTLPWLSSTAEVEKGRAPNPEDEDGDMGVDASLLIRRVRPSLIEDVSMKAREAFFPKLETRPEIAFPSSLEDLERAVPCDVVPCAPVLNSVPRTCCSFRFFRRRSERSSGERLFSVGGGGVTLSDTGRRDRLLPGDTVLGDEVKKEEGAAVPANMSKREVVVMARCLDLRRSVDSERPWLELRRYGGDWDLAADGLPKTLPRVLFFKRIV